MTRVFNIEGEDWVIKEGRWDWDSSFILDWLKIPFPADISDKVMSRFKLGFLPREETIKKHFKEYIELRKYLGYYENILDNNHPNLKEIIETQKEIRQKAIGRVEEIEKHFKIKINKKINEVFESEEFFYNFLPKEYLVVGESISPQNKSKDTYYIIQEQVKGRNMHDTKMSKLNQSQRKQLAGIIYMTLVMIKDTGLIPDMKPKRINMANHWLAKTDNLIWGKDGLKLVDTRWFWDYYKNPLRRGLIIPELMVNSCKFYLNSTLKDVS
ncbi:MAG TPA: hypothetical protein VGA67_01335 [Candidatus Dojkabacteria bacterium]|jgi:hypothetical protein